MGGSRANPIPLYQPYNANQSQVNASGVNSGLSPWMANNLQQMYGIYSGQGSGQLGSPMDPIGKDSVPGSVLRNLYQTRDVSLPFQVGTRGFDNNQTYNQLSSAASSYSNFVMSPMNDITMSANTRQIYNLLGD